jgi:shikimate dehydrogenase
MTDLYAVIGNPIIQSKSPFIHTLFAEAAGEHLAYIALEAPPDGFAAKVDTFRRGGGRGLNVTTPFKLDAFAYATEASARAKRAGAVNAMKFEAGRALAENFDGLGLVADVETNLGFPIAGRRVLIAGAGGASRGAIEPVLAAGPAALVVANRTAGKAAELAAHFTDLGRVEGVGYPELEGMPPFDLVVNATSASLRAEAPGLPAAAFASGALAYEMVYGRGLTPFLLAARDAGAGRLADGVGMLVEQAAEAFLWWRGVRPDTAPAIAALMKPLR